MKKKDLLIFSILFLACIIFTADIVLRQLTGNRLFARGNHSTTELTSPVERCTDEPAPGRSATQDPQLNALPEYEAACQSAFIDNMMIFTNMPISKDDANQMADSMAIRLNRFDEQKIQPIVIIEPDSKWGLVDFHEYAEGVYDPWINDYFNRLRQNGITDTQMGIWIPFPEPQQTFWNNNKDPDDFAKSTNKYFSTLRSQFPAARTAVLLDSQVNSENQASQLLAYTRLLDNSLVDIAGLQGFPWHPSEEQLDTKPVVSASVFAPAYLLEEVAKSLDTKEVLLNIGSYRQRKIDNGGEIAISSKERASVLDSIAYEINLLQNAGYTTTVNIFAENKLETKEGVNWSYWQPGANRESAQTSIFTDFIKRIDNDKTRISIFDSRN